jgi:hypothetical protein
MADFTEKEPKTLYHYTTIGGLLGILKERNIWATNINYLNDRQEFQDVLDLLTKRIIKLQSTLDTESIMSGVNLESIGEYSAGATEKNLAKRLGGQVAVKKESSNDNVGLYERVHLLLKNLSKKIYVCSFSKNDDQLSQWRAYCPEASGFSIGFNCQRLKDIALEDGNGGLGLQKCVYKDTYKTKMTDDVFESVEKAGLKDTDFVMKVAIELLLMAPSFKNSSFYEEEEWRIALSEPQRDKIRFREGNSLIIPYGEIDLKDENGDLPIELIRIGPTANPIEARLSLNILLEQYGIKNVKIKQSEIPYRGQT